MRLYLICANVLSLLVGVSGRAQAPSIPPDVQAIMNKAKSGQTPTKAETARMQQWAQSMSGAASGGGAGGASAAPAIGAPGPTLPRPPARALLVTTVAPTRAEYVVLVKSLAETYGRKLGTHRAEFDRIFAKQGAGSSPAQAAATLYISGAAGASVYASAVAAAANPDDFQVASNLGVALDTIPDPKAASAVLLYARKLAPEQALPALNLAWVYFNSGHTSEAKTLFQKAAALDPDLSGPPAGLGMLASSSGDTATAMSMFRKSLSKSYSGVVAAGFVKAQQAQEQEQQKQSPNEPPPSFPPSGDAESSPLPELPVKEDPRATVASTQAFQQAMSYADKETQAAMARLQDAQSRVMAIGRRAQIDPDGTIDLPRLFDKQLFEYSQIAMLTVGTVAREGEKTIKQAVGVMAPGNQQNVNLMSADADTFIQLQKDQIAALEARDFPRVKVIQQQMDDLAYKDCKRLKENLGTNYAQTFKIWKRFSDSSRASVRDLYAYSQPVIDQIWVPALNDFVQARRELAVLNMYKQCAGCATVVAGQAKAYSQLKCLPPEPPKPPETVKDPTLTKKEPDCPLNPPVKLSLVVVKMELGCDKVKISGGEVLRVEVERTFGKSTAIWVGVGAAASLPGISLGGGGSLGDNGKSWSPPGTMATASTTAQVMVGVRFGDSGAVEDVSIKSTVSATGSAGPLSGSIGISATASLENGPNVAPILTGSIGK